MEQEITALLTSHTQLGYFVLFIGAFLETSAFVGLLVPGETLVVVAGLLASQGILRIEYVLLCAALGAVGGDSVSYVIGAVYGERLLTKVTGRFFIKKSYLTEARSFYARHGGKAVFFGRFVGWLRAVVPLLAGVSHMRYPRFLFFDVYGCALWALLFSMLGYVLGSGWRTILAAMHRVGLEGAIAIGLLILVWYVLHKRRLGHHAVSRFDAALSSQFPSSWQFLKARFEAGSAYGLSLTFSLIVLALAIAGFGQIADQWREHEYLYRLDHTVHAYMAAHTTAGATSLATWVSRLGSTYVLLAAAVGLAVYLVRKQELWMAFKLVHAFLFGEAFLYLAKFFFERGRPAGSLIEGSAMSFPSGHAFNAMLAFGFLTYVVITLAKGEIARFFVPSVSALVILGVGLSRLYLGTHWFTDVIGGYAAALAWLTLSIVVGSVLQNVLARSP